MVGLAGGRVEDRHHEVSRIVDDGSLVLEEARDHRCVVPVEERDDLLGLVALGIGREPPQVGEQCRDLHHGAPECGLVGIGEQPGDDGRRQVAAEQRVDRAVQPRVLELDGELRGDGGRHRPVAVVEGAVLTLEGNDAGGLVFHQERRDECVVSLDGRAVHDRVDGELGDQGGQWFVADRLEPTVVQQRERDVVTTETGAELDRGAVEQRVLVVEHGGGATYLDETAELVGGLPFTFERQRGAFEHFLLRLGEIELVRDGGGEPGDFACVGVTLAHHGDELLRGRVHNPRAPR